MIDRYARPRMKQVWSDENKYDKWLLIELAVCEAWTQAGVIPEEDMEKLRVATYDIDRLNEILRVTRHDMTAFLGSMTEQLGPEGRLASPGTYDKRRLGHRHKPADGGRGGRAWRRD